MVHFGEEYASKEGGDKPISFSGNEHTGTVQVSTQGENVVAPGTKNDTGLGFVISGKPEVDVKINTTVDIDTVKTVYLRKGSYAVMSKLNNVTEENFDADSLYIKKLKIQIPIILLFHMSILLNMMQMQSIIKLATNYPLMTMIITP